MPRNEIDQAAADAALGRAVREAVNKARRITLIQYANGTHCVDAGDAGFARAFTLDEALARALAADRPP